MLYSPPCRIDQSKFQRGHVTPGSWGKCHQITAALWRNQRIFKTRYGGVVCNYLPLQSNPGPLWWSPIQEQPELTDPASFLRSDEIWLAWVIPPPIPIKPFGLELPILRQVKVSPLPHHPSSHSPNLQTFPKLELAAPLPG